MIRWREQDIKQITNLVRQFNAKITRIEKKFPEIESYLPERINKQMLMGKIETRQDYNRVVNSYKRFMRKGAEAPIMNKQGLQVTLWEKREMQIATATINRKRSMQRKKADVSTEKGTMGSIEKMNLLPKKFNFESMGYEAFQKFKETVEKQIMSNYYKEKDELYKANYIKALENIFGKGNKLIPIVNKISSKRLVQLFYEDPNMQIDFIYDPIEIESVFEILEETLANEVHS